MSSKLVQTISGSIFKTFEFSIFPVAMEKIIFILEPGGWTLCTYISELTRENTDESD